MVIRIIKIINILIIILVFFAIPSTAFSQEIIVIDAMYGGKNIGPRYKNFLSKQITLDIAKEVGELLLKSGKKVIYTRDKDTFIELDKRIEIANINKGNIFISIGINNAEKNTANGFEIYTSPEVKPGTQVTIDSKIYSLAEAKPELQQMLKDLTINEQNLHSKKLAESLRKNIKKSTGLYDRGIKNALFKTLIRPDMPSVLIMIGFMTNDGDREFMINSNNQKKLAISILEGIKYYLETKEKEKESGAKKKETD